MCDFYVSSCFDQSRSKCVSQVVAREVWQQDFRLRILFEFIIITVSSDPSESFVEYTLMQRHAILIQEDEVGILICVESDKKRPVDWLYIESLVKTLFDDDKTVVRRPIYMNSRSNYNSNKVQREILLNKKKGYESVIVVYCIDTDQYEVNANQKKELEAIEKYCTANGYELVWFCHDIEEALIGKSISDSEKYSRAVRFVKKDEIKGLDIERLTKDKYQKGSSNIVKVLSKFLPLK